MRQGIREMKAENVGRRIHSSFDLFLLPSVIPRIPCRIPLIP